MKHIDLLSPLMIRTISLRSVILGLILLNTMVTEAAQHKCTSNLRRIGEYAIVLGMGALTVQSLVSDRLPFPSGLSSKPRAALIQDPTKLETSDKAQEWQVLPQPYFVHTRDLYIALRHKIKGTDNTALSAQELQDLGDHTWSIANDTFFFGSLKMFPLSSDHPEIWQFFDPEGMPLGRVDHIESEKTLLLRDPNGKLLAEVHRQTSSASGDDSWTTYNRDLQPSETTVSTVNVGYPFGFFRPLIAGGAENYQVRVTKSTADPRIALVISALEAKGQ